MAYCYVPQALAATRAFLAATRGHLACAVQRTVPKTTTDAQKAELVETTDSGGSRNSAVNSCWLARWRTSRQGSRANQMKSLADHSCAARLRPERLLPPPGTQPLRAVEPPAP